VYDKALVSSSSLNMEQLNPPTATMIIATKENTIGRIANHPCERNEETAGRASWAGDKLQEGEPVLYEPRLLAR
jgi:hypothetical protein